VAEYNYTDESGTLLYQVTRHEPKDFRQRRPDGNGGWIPSLKYADGTLAIRPVLYNLPEVIANDIIFIVEGEKDCETLRDHGFVGTKVSGLRSWRGDVRVFATLKWPTVAHDLPSLPVSRTPEAESNHGSRLL
jgi:hypothetical protein